MGPEKKGVFYLVKTAFEQDNPASAALGGVIILFLI
jgi:hypothetical protein